MTVTHPRRISILGSTGSIGCNTIKLLQDQPDVWQIVALTAQNNIDKLIEQALELHPQRAVIGNEAHYQTLKDALAGTQIEAAAGADAIAQAAAMPADWTMAAIVGAAGLRPTMQAIAQGNIVALANKECLVCAGELMIAACREHGTTLLPVDSEHNAIFQVLDATQPESIARITLTASGGPFRTFTADQMRDVTPAQAVNHPNWSMGAKISVDSATMMNKGLELIEAYHLFPIEVNQLDVIVHPESIIHSLVHYRDGSILAQLGAPDMRIPIGYTLHWPTRQPTSAPQLDLTQLSSLHFEAPDPARFPALTLAKDALEAGQAATIALNAANEVAVAQFLQDCISFPTIAEIIAQTLDKIALPSIHSLDDVLECDQLARDIAQQHITN